LDFQKWLKTANYRTIFTLTFIKNFLKIRKKGQSMKKFIFILTLTFPIFANANPENSDPCLKYDQNYCNEHYIHNLYGIELFCEKERCPNRLIIEDKIFYRSFLACPDNKPLMDKNGRCYSCEDEKIIEILEHYKNPCPKRKTFYPVNERTLEKYESEGKRLAPSCSPDKPLLIQEGFHARCIECDDEFENYPRVISKQDCDACPNRTYFSGWCVNGTKEKPLVSAHWVQDGRGYQRKQQNVSCETDEDILMNYFGSGSDWCSAVCPNRFRMKVTKFPNVYAFCVKKTVANHIRNHWLKIILFGIISLFLLPKILKKLNKR
jgi:hypothetical protein